MKRLPINYIYKTTIPADLGLTKIQIICVQYVPRPTQINKLILHAKLLKTLGGEISVKTTRNTYVSSDELNFQIIQVALIILKS